MTELGLHFRSRTAVFVFLSLQGQATGNALWCMQVLQANAVVCGQRARACVCMCFCACVPYDASVPHCAISASLASQK